MLGFALFGAGRIGRMHALNIDRHPGARVECVYDTNREAATELAHEVSTQVAVDGAEALARPGVDVVLIASATPTHIDFITKASEAGKAVFCEKPIDLDIERVERCRAVVERNDTPVQLGFNRRFDASHAAVAKEVHAGGIGALEQLVIVSRDPSPPPMSYARESGGLYRDMMIHDFDMMRFISGDEPVSVSAMGQALVTPELKTIDDVDTTIAILTLASGAVCSIHCSRRSSYGYDQRTEAFGSAGMVRSENRTATSVERFDAEGTSRRDPLLPFFVERYADAFASQLDSFINAVTSGNPPAVRFEDGRRALIVADAAQRALATGGTVAIDFD